MVKQKTTGKKKKFVRRNFYKKPKLKKNPKWRRARGRHNKIRLKRKGYSSSPSVGYKRNKKEKGKIRGKKLIIICHKKDLEQADSEHIIRVGKVGLKNKLVILKTIKEKKINFEGDIEEKIKKIETKIKRLQEEKRMKRMKKKEKSKKKKSGKKKEKKEAQIKLTKESEGDKKQ